MGPARELAARGRRAITPPNFIRTLEQPNNPRRFLPLQKSGQADVKPKPFRSWRIRWHVNAYYLTLVDDFAT